MKLAEYAKLCCNFSFFYKKCKKELLIEPNYAGQNAYSRRAYPVPGTGKIGLAPNSHARWVRGDYVSQGSVGITKRKYVVAIWSQFKKNSIEVPPIPAYKVWKSFEFPERYYLVLISYWSIWSSFASISSGIKLKGEKFKLASAVPCTF